MSILLRPRTAARAILAAGTAALIFMGGCASDGGDIKARAGAEASPGCGNDVTDGADEGEHTIDVEGFTHRYLLAMPGGYDGTVPIPLVFNFHSFARDAEQQADYTELDDKGTDRGFAVVTPQATGQLAHWSWTPDEKPRDFTMVDQLLGHLATELCIDTRRVYLTGLSNGALFTAHLACRFGDRIAAIAVVAFTFTPSDCAHRGEIPLVSFHGTFDRLVPYYGGRLPEEIGIGNFDVPPVEDEVSLWGNWNGCSALPLDSQIDTEVRKRAYRDCTDKRDVVFYTVEGGGHNWPGSDPDQYLGHTTQQIDATDIILDFFDSHPKPAA